MHRTRNRPLWSAHVSAQGSFVVCLPLVLRCPHSCERGWAVNLLSVRLRERDPILVFGYHLWLKRHSAQNIVIRRGLLVPSPLVGWRRSPVTVGRWPPWAVTIISVGSLPIRARGRYREGTMAARRGADAACGRAEVFARG